MSSLSYTSTKLHASDNGSDREWLRLLSMVIVGYNTMYLRNRSPSRAVVDCRFSSRSVVDCSRYEKW
jgi:hypothetical protein